MVHGAAAAVPSFRVVAFGEEGPIEQLAALWARKPKVLGYWEAWEDQVWKVLVRHAFRLILRVVGGLGAESLLQARLAVPAVVGKERCFLLGGFLEALDAALTVEADEAGIAESSSVAERVRATSELTLRCVAVAAM
jgi:hypothetical protein